MGASHSALTNPPNVQDHSARKHRCKPATWAKHCVLCQEPGVFADEREDLLARVSMAHDFTTNGREKHLASRRADELLHQTVKEMQMVMVTSSERAGQLCHLLEILRKGAEIRARFSSDVLSSPRFVWITCVMTTMRGILLPEIVSMVVEYVSMNYLIPMWERVDFKDVKAAFPEDFKGIQWPQVYELVAKYKDPFEHLPKSYGFLDSPRWCVTESNHSTRWHGSSLLGIPSPRRVVVVCQSCLRKQTFIGEGISITTGEIYGLLGAPLWPQIRDTRIFNDVDRKRVNSLLAQWLLTVDTDEGMKIREMADFVHMCGFRRECVQEGFEYLMNRLRERMVNCKNSFLFHNASGFQSI
jgi:hypothetical protein